MPFTKRLRSLIGHLRGRRRPPWPTRPLTPADVAVIVLNWNGRDCTLACLESLERAELGGATVVVVDNGSRDGSVEAIRARFPDWRVVALPENQGYAGGNNAGMRLALESGAGALLLLNNDTVVAPDFLAPLLDVLNLHPRAAAVSSAIMRFDSPEVLTEAWLELYFGFGIVRRRGVNCMPGEGYDVVRPVDAGVGCSLLLRAEAVRRIGFLDESYFAYHEEVDWCYRARKAGFEIFYQPYSRVWHHISKSTDVPRRGRRRPRTGAELPNPIPLPWNPVRTYLGARNSVRFIRAHANPWRWMYFWLSTAYNIPLELLAVLVDREEELKLGLLTYRRALAAYFLEQVGASANGGISVRQALRAAARAPVTLFRTFPADVRRAHREGLTAQVEACARGYWDGFLDRPLPLEELGLRAAAPAPPEGERTA
jgi:hypothetical protein